jgi:hypothetical protein
LGTEVTFKGLMTSSSMLTTEYTQSDECKELATQIMCFTASLVSQLEHDTAILYSMKSSVQLQQFLGTEVEKLVLNSEKSAEDSVIRSPGTEAAGTRTTRKKKSNLYRY